jgi:ZIP family zinc transporter
VGVTLSLSVFFSLFTGSFLSILITKWLKVKIDYILSLCAGVLCGVLFLELIPHSLSEYKSLSVILGILIGLPMMFIVDKLMHNHHSYDRKLDKTSSFYFLILAITLHNIPAGLALGNHVDHDGHLFQIIVFHHIPEGITLMMIYFASSLKLKHLFVSFVFLSLSLNAFALLGSVVQMSNGHFLGMVLGLAISTFGYIAIFELFFPSLKIGYRSFHWLSLLTGIFLASIIMIIG